MMNLIQLNRGADSARGDDAASLKLAVASWLNEAQPTPNPPISSRNKSGRGFYNDATAELLCPVDFNWADKRYDVCYATGLYIIVLIMTAEHRKGYEATIITSKLLHTLGQPSCTRMVSMIARTRRKGFSKVLYFSG